MKRLFKVLVPTLVVALLLIACGGNGGGDSNEKLVVYTPSAQENLDVLIPAFEKETGIEVEIVAASTGELIARIQNEKDNPVADVFMGGAPALVLPIKDHFEEYTSIHNDDYPEDYKTFEGMFNQTTIQGSVLLVNTDLAGKGKIKGYRDLLDPDLKGKIAHGDATASSSAFNHIENMLFAINPDDPLSDESWEFVEQFLENLDGKIIQSSGAVHKGVANGEYAVALTWDTAALAYLDGGADNLEVVNMEEGVIFKSGGMAIIKDAKHRENAEKFIDFMTSETAQSLVGLETFDRPVRTDAKLADYKTPMAEINTIPDNYTWAFENKEDVIDVYKELILKIIE